MSTPLSSRENDYDPATDDARGYAAGLLRGAGTGAEWVEKGKTQYLLIPKKTVDMCLAALEGWDYYKGGKNR